MYLDGSGIASVLAPAAPGASIADRLDVSLLHDQVLAPAARASAIRARTRRIDFVGGIRGPQRPRCGRGLGRGGRRVRHGPGRGSSDLMAIADAGGIMPPKSTWFEPKLRDGLLAHLI